MKIEIISGSPRSNSVTRRVALYLTKRLTTDNRHQIGLIDMRDWHLPQFQTVWVSPDKTPDPYKPLAKRIFEADAFILMTPEYNGSYTPALKNLLDHFPKQHHKPFGIVSASQGMMGGIRATQQLILFVHALFGIPSPYFLIVPAVDKKFSPDGDLIDQSFQGWIDNFVAEFYWLAENLVKQ